MRGNGPKSSSSKNTRPFELAKCHPRQSSRRCRTTWRVWAFGGCRPVGCRRTRPSSRSPTCRYISHFRSRTGGDVDRRAVPVSPGWCGGSSGLDSPSAGSPLPPEATTRVGSLSAATGRGGLQPARADRECQHRLGSCRSRGTSCTKKLPKSGRHRARPESARDERGEVLRRRSSRRRPAKPIATWPSITRVVGYVGSLTLDPVARRAYG